MPLSYILALPPGCTSDFHLDISAAPLDPNSAAMLAASGRQQLSAVAYWGDEWLDDPTRHHTTWATPVINIGNNLLTPSVPVTAAPGTAPLFDTFSVPIPDDVKWMPRALQGGNFAYLPLTGDDRHLLLFDPTRLYLWELFFVWFNEAAPGWQASGCQFSDLSRAPFYTQGFATGSGLPFTPGLVSYQECQGPAEINHGFFGYMNFLRPTGWVYPARASDGVGPANAVPMGARLRLKAARDISIFPAEMQRWLRALKRYGTIMCDSPGAPGLGFQGVFDRRWDRPTFNAWNAQLSTLSTDDFEVVQLGWRG